MFIFSALKIRIIAPLCIFFLTALVPASAQEEGKRIALIIGNNRLLNQSSAQCYQRCSPDGQSPPGGRFQNYSKEDATYPVMEEAAAKLAEQLGPDDTALFFYAGHGVQIESENFLVPVDFEPTSTIIEAKFKCFRLAQLFDELKKRTKRSIIILDACRSNPVTEKNALQAGLAQPQLAGIESFIAFSTSPGQVAADNPAGRDSYFTEALGDLINEPGLTLDDVFTRVKARVSSATESRQSPWTISNLTSTFYFHPPSNLQTANDPSVAEKWMLEAQIREQREDWDQAISLVNEVLKRKPGGTLESTATNKLPYLLVRKEAQEKYEASDFNQAGALYEKALNLDPFSIDSAYAAINSYLLSDHLPEAVRLLNAVRVRGTSASVDKANAMLKELGPVYPEAAQVVKTELPAPPAVQELFRNVQFGVPDWTAGIRSAQSAPVAVGRWAKLVDAKYPPPADLTTVQAASNKVDNDLLHVEVNSTGESRDISIRKHSDQEATGSSRPLALSERRRCLRMARLKRNNCLPSLSFRRASIRFRSWKRA